MFWKKPPKERALACPLISGWLNLRLLQMSSITRLQTASWGSKMIEIQLSVLAEVAWRLTVCIGLGLMLTWRSVSLKQNKIKNDIDSTSQSYLVASRTLDCRRRVGCDLGWLADICYRKVYQIRFLAKSVVPHCQSSVRTRTNIIA